MFLKLSQYSQENTSVGVSFYEKEALTRCFSVHLFHRTPPAATSEKKVLLEISQKLTWKLCHSLFFNKVAGLRPANSLKKRLWHRCFPVNFVKYLKNTIFTVHLRAITSTSFIFEFFLFVLSYILLSLQINSTPESYSEPCQTSKMELFATIVNGFSFPQKAQYFMFDWNLKTPLHALQ